MKIPDRPCPHERLSRIARLATTMWRETAADQHLAKLDQHPDRVH